MELEKLDKRIMEELYKSFEDNNGFIVKEGEKYTEAVNRILLLDMLNVNELSYIRNRFVYTVADILTSLRDIPAADKMYNVYLNMMQYVTVEIDSNIVKMGGNV